MILNNFHSPPMMFKIVFSTQTICRNEYSNLNVVNIVTIPRKSRLNLLAPHKTVSHHDGCSVLS